VRADLIAGLTAAAVVIPKAMAYGTIAGVPLEVGLYTALVPMVVYAFTGTSRSLSVSTTSTIAILVAGSVALAPAGTDPALVASSLALGAGVALLAAWLLRLGFLADFISAPVLTGFKAGIAVVVIVDQLPKLLGVHYDKGTVLQSAMRAVQHVPEASLATVLVALTAVAIVVVLEHFWPTSPAPLIAVGLAIAASAVIGLDRYGVALVGAVTSGLPRFALPDVKLSLTLWPEAAGIALMSFVETIAAGRAFVRQGEPLPSANRELFAIGLANITGSALGNMPSGGGTSQTAVNSAAGARTQVAGLVTAATTLATILFLSSLVALLPHAALAAVVVATTAPLFSVRDFAAILAVRRMEFLWAVAAAVGVVTLGTLDGILVAVVISVLMLFYKANRRPVYEVGRRLGTDAFEPVAAGDARIATVPGLLMLRVEGRLHFANARRIGDKIWPLINEAKPRIVVIDMSAVLDLEYTALKALTEAEQKLRSLDMTLWLVAMNPQVHAAIKRSPLGKTLGTERMYFTLGDAVNAFNREGGKQ